MQGDLLSVPTYFVNRYGKMCVIIAMEIIEILFIIMITKCQIKIMFLQIVLLTSDRWHILGIFDNYF